MKTVSRRIERGGRQKGGEKKEDVVRRREGGPDYISRTISTIFNFRSNTNLFSSLLPLLPLLLIPDIFPSLPFYPSNPSPPLGRRDSKKKKSYEQFAASVSARPSVGRPKKIHPLLLTRQGFDCRKFHQLVNAEKKKRKRRKREKKNYLVTFTPPHQLSILIPSLTHSIGFVTALETKKKKKRQLVVVFSFLLFLVLSSLRYWVEEGG